METYGDLKKAIRNIQLKKKGEKVGKVALDVILGAIPGLSAAKSTFDVVSSAFRKPDTKKSNSWLDKLDIDDEMEAIVDDTVENGFLKMQAKVFDSEPDDKKLESDFNMNAKMVNYLKNTYKQRTITGISEQKSVFDKFFTKFAYKFDKGYPDMNNDQDVLLLESLISEAVGYAFKLTETALSPTELSKDATLAGGEKKPRIGILIDLIQNDNELELNDGTKFIVDNKEEVISQLKGKTRITTAIKLVDKEGKQITTSNLKKTAAFGGGGGMRGGSELTAKAESAQCIVNEIRYSSGEIKIEDVTDEAIELTKNKIEVTDFDGASDLLKTNPGWLNSSVSIANKLASSYSGPFIQNRGSDWVKNLEDTVKPKLKEVGIKDINKWSPADIWMVAPDEMNINWPDTLSEINTLLLEKYNDGKIIGVSLKKAGNSASLKVYNDPTIETSKVKYEGLDVRPTHAKGIILLDGGLKIEFRNFSGETGFMGEIIGKKAAGGKVGYSILKKALNDNGIQLSDPKVIRKQVIENDPEFKVKFKKLWDETENLDSADFEGSYNNPSKTPNQNLLYRISKYLGLELVNAIVNSDNPDEIVNDLINYASSSTNDSAVFVKAS